MIDAYQEAILSLVLVVAHKLDYLLNVCLLQL